MEQECSVAEDSLLHIRLLADDPDGFLGYGGLDTLTFTITTDPRTAPCNPWAAT